MPFNTITGNDLLQQCTADFDGMALQQYRYQYERNELYRRYNDALHIVPGTIRTPDQIPFLPISFFKSHQVKSYQGNEALLFESSGTSGMVPSRHFVRDRHLYHSVALNGFEQFYGDPGEWIILALLPSYLERKTSSLVDMAQMLMSRSAHPDNGFYLDDFGKLYGKLQQLNGQGKKVLLLGVTFALLDFAEAYPMDMEGIVVMETGGMKGRKEEWTREQVHHFLKERWQLAAVHSEYGMTELLSQAYATHEGRFRPVVSMRAMIRDLQDPLDTARKGSGVLNIIDLANVHSCSFIATEDMGKVYDDGSFEVLGRMDFAALRGCSLMVR